MRKKITWALIVAVSVLLILGILTSRLPFSMLEVIGFVTGIVSVQYAVENNGLTWPTGIANSTAFLLLFLPVGLYANVVLQVIYIGQGVWGWRLWRKHESVQFSPRILFLALLLVTLPATLAAMRVIEVFGWSAPFWDTLTSVVSILATYLLGKRFVQNWYLWIGVDIIYIVLFASQGLFLTSVLYIVLLFQAIAGLMAWRATGQRELSYAI